MDSDWGIYILVVLVLLILSKCGFDNVEREHEIILKKMELCIKKERYCEKSKQ